MPPSISNDDSTKWENIQVRRNPHQILRQLSAHVVANLFFTTYDFCLTPPNEAWSNLNKLIYNCNWVLSLLEGLEEQRPLSRLEPAFRKLVISHHRNLQESKRIYWRQRNTPRWVKLGDENSHFFYIMATAAHKRNFIIGLTDHNGFIVSDHEQKANLLWNSFRNRMGVSEFTDIYYDLSSIINTVALPNTLDSDFSTQEIDNVIRSLPNEHAPGPDGFSGIFIKNCGIL